MYPSGSNRSTRTERLACHPNNTLFITQEPSDIKIYGPGFLSQYGHVLSAQSSSTLHHDNHIHYVSPIRWFYGRPLEKNDHNYATHDQLSQMDSPNKNRLISTVCSDKTMTPTLKARFELTAFLKSNLGEEFDWFGRGIRPINDKSEGLDSYKYHLAVENFISPHYWTEKIADSFLAYCLPFYYGPDNITDYFEADSFIPVDIFKPEETLGTIQKHLADQTYEKRLSAIKKARNQVLNDYNMMSVIARIVKDKHQEKPRVKDTEILGRHGFRKAHPIKAMSDLAFRAKTKT